MDEITSWLISGFSSISSPHPSWHSCGPTPPPTTRLIDSLLLLLILPLEILLNPITNYILAGFWLPILKDDGEAASNSTKLLNLFSKKRPYVN